MKYLCPRRVSSVTQAWANEGGTLRKFDCKPCYTKKFVEQKMDYIHRNPCSGKWNLADEFTDYKHSSRAFYELDLPGTFPVMDYRLIEWL